MTELSRKVLDAIAAKREAAAELTLSQEQAERQFASLFAELLGALDELQAAKVGNSSGLFSFAWMRRYDSQGRFERFDGIKFGFGEMVPKRVSNLVLLGGNGGFRLSGEICNSWRLGPRVRAIGKYDCYSSGAWVDIKPGKEDEITSLVIDYIAEIADR